MADETARLLWLDAETTGLHPASAALLEVAALVTDTDLNVLDEDGYHAVVYYPETAVEDLRAAADPVVQRMHDDTGLWTKLPRGKLLATIDEEITDYLRGFAPAVRQSHMAGNSIHLDRSFAEIYLPRLDAHLHHRMVDVSSFALVAGWWLRKPPVFEKRYTHSARQDIRESLAQLRLYREQWLQPPF